MRAKIWATGLLAACVIALLLMPVPFKGRAWAAAGDLVHAPLFGVLSFAAVALLESVRPLRDQFAKLTARSIAVVAAMSLLGGLIELVQQRIGRSASWHDAASNLLGSCAAILAYVGWRWQRCRPHQKIRSQSLFILAGCLWSLSWYTPVMVLRDALYVELKFPLLASFETRAEMGRLWFEDSRGTRTRADATDGQYSLDLTCDPTPLPRVSLIELHSDWSHAEALEIDVRMVEPKVDSVTLIIRVVEEESIKQDDGDAAASFRGLWTLEPGPMTRIRISREAMLAGSGNRSLDLSRIRCLDVGLVQPESKTQLRIDRIRIVR